MLNANQREKLAHVNRAAPDRGVDPIRVMIVDDSALMRKLLTQVLSRDPRIEVIDTAIDGLFALEHLNKVHPDVVLLDVDMPRLDGLATLDRIVAEHALPVVMCSIFTKAGASITLDALSRGAVDFIEKPTVEELISGKAAEVIAKQIHRAARFCAHVDSRPRRRPASSQNPYDTNPPTAAGQMTSSSVEHVAKLARQTLPEIVALGTSTGGPSALERIVCALPAHFPLGIVIVQHMPASFTEMLAQHLDRHAAINVREAREGDAVSPGVALIAPGDVHMRIRRSSTGYFVSLDGQAELVNGHRPSVDVLFESLAVASLGHAAAVIMTGMGDDGANGMGRLAAAGAVTIAQSPGSCICHRMPKSAIDRGYARAVVPLDELASALMACGAATRKPTS